MHSGFKLDEVYYHLNTAWTELSYILYAVAVLKRKFGWVDQITLYYSSCGVVRQALWRSSALQVSTEISYEVIYWQLFTDANFEVE